MGLSPGQYLYYTNCPLPLLQKVLWVSTPYPTTLLEIPAFAFQNTIPLPRISNDFPWILVGMKISWNCTLNKPYSVASVIYNNTFHVFFELLIHLLHTPGIFFLNLTYSFSQLVQMFTERFPASEKIAD